VNETAQNLPKKDNDDTDNLNSPERLSMEAAYINRNFSLQVLGKGKRFPFDKPNPFQSGVTEDEVAPIGYRYKKWDLGDGNILVCRCELNGVLEEQQKVKFCSIRALNEYDPKVTGVDWRQSLTTQRGAVLANELKNNSHKLSKWTAQAFLAGADYLKLGYVSRVNSRNATNHVILGVQTYNPLEFASQKIGLSIANMWGIFKYFVNMCLKLERGTYVLLKDPYKPLIRLYEVPDDTFDVIDKEEEI